ncbi:MAG: DUF3874 domain-containing protein [Tannerellaceae bacterium]|nr:DUF3874 domain-containing protein [Tannerellaceae bacterium]
MAIEILEEIRKRSKIPLADYKIVHFGRILKELGILSKRSKQGAVYKVVEVNNQE